MIISGADISTYGLRLIKLSGELDQPSRKKILKEPGFEAKDIRFKNNQVEARLMGKYADQQTLSANIEQLKTRLFDGKLNFEFPDHGLTFLGYCERGVKVKVYKNIAHCTLKITVD